jgi:hypothetical protein
MSEETSELRKAGLKVTHPRLQILRLLEQTDQKHMTADEIYRALTDQGEEIGLATVYRVLNQFESAGLVRKHMFDRPAAATPRPATSSTKGSPRPHGVRQDRARWSSSSTRRSSAARKRLPANTVRDRRPLTGDLRATEKIIRFPVSGFRFPENRCPLSVFQAGTTHIAAKPPPNDLRLPPETGNRKPETVTPSQASPPHARVTSPIPHCRAFGQFRSVCFCHPAVRLVSKWRLWCCP